MSAHTWRIHGSTNNMSQEIRYLGISIIYVFIAFKGFGIVVKNYNGTTVISEIQNFG